MEPEVKAEKKGTELLQKAIKEVVADIKLGIEIGKGGVHADDIVHVPAVIERVKSILDLAGHSAELVAEAKDIDMSEVGILVAASWSGFQEVTKKEEA